MEQGGGGGGGTGAGLQPRYCIAMCETRYEVFRKLLEYVYCGSFEATTAQASALLRVAEDFRLAHLKALCEQKLQRSLEAANVLEYLTLAHEYRAEELKKLALHFVYAHRKKVSDRLKDELSKELLKEVKKFITVQGLEQLAFKNQRVILFKDP